MLNRSGLFLLAIIGAVLVPYFMSAEQAGTRARVAQIWDKMFVDTVSDRFPADERTRFDAGYGRDPISSTSPLPRQRRRESSFGARGGRTRTDVPPWEYQPAEVIGRPSSPTFNDSAANLRSTYSAYPSNASAPPQYGAVQDPLAPMTYPDNPLQGIAPEQGATEWKTVSPQSSGLTTALPIPHTPAGSALPGVAGIPDEEGWVTVGPAAGYPGATAMPHVGTVASPATIVGSVAGAYPGVPPGAQILPGIVVGGPGNQSVASSAGGRQVGLSQDLGQLLRFDHAPGWVVDSWPRVSTHIIQRDLSGMRVPLVSGTDATALAGSLSYYFDRMQKLQRISFEGATGDPTRLINLLSEEYGLKVEPSLGGGMFVSRNPADSQAVDSITNVLRLRRAPIVRDSLPLQKYLVMLELNRPDSDRRLSQNFTSLLQLDQRSQRWTPGATPDGKPPQYLDPMDPFSPLSPNDPRPTLTPAPDNPTPAANPAVNPAAAPPATTGRGVIPSDGQFQSDRIRQTHIPNPATVMNPAATMPPQQPGPVPQGRMVPALQNIPPPMSQPNPLRPAAPST